MDGTRSLPGKSENKYPTGDEFTAACCVPLKACSDYVGDGDGNDVSVATRGTVAAAAVGAIIVAMATFM